MNLFKNSFVALCICTAAAGIEGCKKDHHQPNAPTTTIKDTTYVYTVSTLAGSGNTGFADGVGSAASFNLPTGAVADKSGNIYIADGLNRAIRKITPDGTVTVIAGNGTTGHIDGLGTLARFDCPSGITIDAAGNLYISDAVGSLIRKITPDGNVSTIAGGILNSSANGTGSMVGFNIPKDLTITSTGYIYVADTYNHLIRQITPDGVVSTFAGNGSPALVDGTATKASFNYPTAITVDSKGNLYVADAGNNAIRKITPDGMVSTLAGSAAEGSSDGTGANAYFKYPQGITIDAKNNLYVSDGQNNRIRKITLKGVVTTIAGSGMPGRADGVGTAATFNYPLGLTTDAAGNIYVVDDNYIIRKITVTAKY